MGDYIDPPEPAPGEYEAWRDDQMTDEEFEQRIIDRVEAHIDRIRKRSPKAYKIFMERLARTVKIIEECDAVKKTVAEGEGS